MTWKKMLIFIASSKNNAWCGVNITVLFEHTCYRLTCVYLSCKVEEFNVSIGQFVGNLKGDREKFANIILGFELLLMDKLHYHLTVHNPFRPLEGFLIDLKVSSTPGCYIHDIEFTLKIVKKPHCCYLLVKYLFVCFNCVQHMFIFTYSL